MFPSHQGEGQGGGESHSEGRLLYIVASMEEELAGLRREMEALEPSGGVGFPVEVHRVGIGPKRAGAAMAAALANGKRRPQGVLLLGVAGAVDPGMETGEMVLAGSYQRDTGDEPAAEAVMPDPAMVKLAEAAAASSRIPPSRTSSLTVDHLILENWERQQLRDKYGVASVNMEDHAVAGAARDAGVPFISVRVILDTAEQRLPGYLPKLSRGRNAILTEVLMKPWRIPMMLHLKSQMDLCQAVLTRFGMSYLKLEAERRRSVREKASADAIY